MCILMYKRNQQIYIPQNFSENSSRLQEKVGVCKAKPN